MRVWFLLPADVSTEAPVRTVEENSSSSRHFSEESEDSPNFWLFRLAPCLFSSSAQQYCTRHGLTRCFGKRTHQLKQAVKIASQGTFPKCMHQHLACVVFTVLLPESNSIPGTLPIKHHI
eukprot:1159865-Pelagomonas_calceolata.AAC.6